MKTSLVLFYIQFLPVDSFHVNITHWTINLHTLLLFACVFLLCSAYLGQRKFLPLNDEWQMTGFPLHRPIQTTVGRQITTMWVQDASSCWGVTLQTLTATWPGAEQGGGMWACPVEWRSGLGYCGFYLCRLLMLEPTPVRKGIKHMCHSGCVKRFNVCKCWLMSQLDRKWQTHSNILQHPKPSNTSQH